MNPLLEKFFGLFGADRRKNLYEKHIGHEPTSKKKGRPASRQNHSKGESKARRKMAAASRRINRGK